MVFNYKCVFKALRGFAPILTYFTKLANFSKNIKFRLSVIAFVAKQYVNHIF
jgi:hypothetical protein